VAAALQGAGLATLLIDLLTAEEETIDLQTAQLRFNIGLLADRLAAATDWLGHHGALQSFHVGLFGASTGAAAALVAAARRPRVVRAVVSRGGRPDLAGREVLEQVTAPTLLIVGGADTPIVQLNRWALDLLNGEKILETVPGASHLFEEPGALEQVALLASAWLVRHLAVRTQAPSFLRPN
jgi:pimeloyl-ACP methyl ester carboxylesterase